MIQAVGLVPNPGSDEALAMGCLCACMDNHYGAGMPYPDGPRFWVQADCPLHGVVKPEMRLVKNVAEQDTQVDD